MARKVLPDDREAARLSADSLSLSRWNASPTSISTSTSYPPANHAGPSRLRYDPRSSADYELTARTPQYTDMPGPSEAWPIHARDLSRPMEAYPRTHSIGDPTAAGPHYRGAPALAAIATADMAAAASFTTSFAQPAHRRSSDEGWQRHQHEVFVPGIIPTPASASALQASLGREALSRVEADFGPTPAETHPSASMIPNADADPPRARVACSFCRVRKLRCDGAMPCRHCERRSIDCVYAPAKTKAKTSARTPSSAGKDAISMEPSKVKHVKQDAGSSSRDRGQKRPVLANTKVENEASSSTEPSKRIKLVDDSSDRADSGGSTSQTLSTPSSSMPGSDLAMIQNNDTPIPMEPTFGDQDDWWNHVLGIFGTSRSTSLRIVRHLLTRFVQSNAVFFGLLHTPTLLEVVSGHRGLTRADPALYLAVLAVSACDMHQTRMADERTADMRSANEASRQLATRLSAMAANYLQTSTAHGSALTPAVGQAASILALTQPDGSSQQSDLIRLAENVVRTLRLHETVSTREPLLQDSEPDSPLYWSRPLTSDSPESEVKYESIVRLCWTGISHRFRKYIAEPDEGFGDVDLLPEFIQAVRPMAFWQPSLLPEELPPPFFHSQDLMRRSAHLSRLTVSLAQLEKIQEVDQRSDSPLPETLEQVRGLLRSLDQLEKAFVRHWPRSDAERQNVLGRTVQMFCRMHVWVRLTIWRKYKLWNHPAASAEDAAEASTSSCSSSALFQQQPHHATVEFWLTIVNEMVGQMQQDLDAHVVDGTALRTSVSDVDALARHVICACDLVEASQRRGAILGLVDGALVVLKRVLAYAALNGEAGKDGLRVAEDVVDKVGVAEARRWRLEGVVAEDGGRAGA